MRIVGVLGKRNEGMEKWRRYGKKWRKNKGKQRELKGNEKK